MDPVTLFLFSGHCLADCFYQTLEVLLLTSQSKEGTGDIQREKAQS